MFRHSNARLVIGGQTSFMAFGRADCVQSSLVRWLCSPSINVSTLIDGESAGVKIQSPEARHLSHCAFRHETDFWCGQFVCVCVHVKSFQYQCDAILFVRNIRSRHFGIFFFSFFRFSTRLVVLAVGVVNDAHRVRILNFSIRLRATQVFGWERAVSE